MNVDESEFPPNKTKSVLEESHSMSFMSGARAFRCLCVGGNLFTVRVYPNGRARALYGEVDVSKGFQKFLSVQESSDVSNTLIVQMGSTKIELLREYAESLLRFSIRVYNTHGLPNVPRTIEVTYTDSYLLLIPKKKRVQHYVKRIEGTSRIWDILELENVRVLFFFETRFIVFHLSNQESHCCTHTEEEG